MKNSARLLQKVWNRSSTSNMRSGYGTTFPISDFFSNTAIRKALHRPLADPGSGHLKQIFILPPLAPASPEIDKRTLCFLIKHFFIRIFFLLYTVQQ